MHPLLRKEKNYKLFSIPSLQQRARHLADGRTEGRGKAFPKRDGVSAQMGTALPAPPGRWAVRLGSLFRPSRWPQQHSRVLTVPFTVRLDNREWVFLECKIRPVNLYRKRTLGFLYLCREGLPQCDSPPVLYRWGTILHLRYDYSICFPYNFPVAEWGEGEEDGCLAKCGSFIGSNEQSVK